MRKIKIATTKKRTDCDESSSENPREQALFAAPFPFGGKISPAAVYAGGPGERSYFDFANILRLMYLLSNPDAFDICKRTQFYTIYWDGIDSIGSVDYIAFSNQNRLDILRTDTVSLPTLKCWFSIKFFLLIRL